MKIRYPLLLILLLMAVGAQAQTALLQQGNQWYYNVYCLIMPNCGYTNYSVGQDTLINDVSGTIVHESSLQELATEPESEIIILRQSNDTVFKYSPEAQVWHTLYDFGAQPGDIWDIQSETYVGYGEEDQPETFRITVDSIDQIVIGQNTHRVIYTSAWSDGIVPSDFHFGNNGGRIIEGIGPVDQAHGLIGQSVFEMLPLQNPSFACFLNNDELIWGSDSSPCNALSVEGMKPSLAKLNIYPNPAFESFQIELPDKSAVLQFYTTDHKLQKIVELSGRFQHTSISLEGLTPGFYIIRLIDQDGKVMGYNKMVKL
ncbi:T9SS type A sorting domain-containing protein [Cryomorpha ignava]|uniref:T9SS type A sorting domain-containing protein n=1 Tax=Cryomorpha ignava TaxID=101383 RepID=A0A7K3WNF2_9FLAO|nr:T9SS type A sorting domain-containing protein [Cryomorpha ignava]NEN22531.1 T9SS type A sorting domain-containing protein [Cryomorpha ignava]